MIPAQRHPSRQSPAAPVYPFARWHRRSLELTGVLLLLTGTAWLALHYSVGAGTGELPHPLESWLMRLHGLAAYAGVFVLGIVAAVHVPQGWRLTRQPRWAAQRRTGITLSVCAALLSCTGYLLYYFAPEWLRPSLGWTHAAVGVAMAGLLLIHRKGRLQHGL